MSNNHLFCLMYFAAMDMKAVKEVIEEEEEEDDDVPGIDANVFMN